MQRLEVSGVVRPVYGSLGVKGLILKMRLVPPSLPRSSYVLRICPFGLYCSACFGILFVSILCTCFNHFSLYCFISFTMFFAPAFSYPNTMIPFFPLFFEKFWKHFETFWTYFRKNNLMSNFMTIHSVGTELLDVTWRSDRHTWRNWKSLFALMRNAPKNCTSVFLKASALSGPLNLLFRAKPEALYFASKLPGPTTD